MTPIYLKNWRQKNKKKLGEINRRSYKNNREKRVEDQRKDYQENREKARQQNRAYYLKRKEKETKKYLRKARYERKNPGRCKRYYDNNKIKVLARQKKHRKEKRAERLGA